MLIDTSVWVDHLRKSDPILTRLLREEEIECHPFIIGELALGSLRRGSEILRMLKRLPHVRLASHDEVLSFVNAHQLSGQGIGWIDAHLLASTAMDRTTLLTRDGRLAAVAESLGLAADA